MNKTFKSNCDDKSETQTQSIVPNCIVLCSFVVPISAILKCWLNQITFRGMSSTQGLLCKPWLEANHFNPTRSYSFEKFLELFAVVGQP